MKEITLFKKILMIGFLMIFGFSYSPAENNYESGYYNKLLYQQSQKDSINPLDVFEQVWQLLNTNYPYFDQRGIDWPALYKVYRAKLSPESTEEELFSTLCSMLGNLNEGHINLSNGNTEFNSGITNGRKMEDFSWKLMRDKYLKGSFKSSPDSMIYYGWVTEDITYMRIRRFPTHEVVEGYIDSIIQELMKAKGIIIDIRGNPGGNGFGVEMIGSRFADRKRLFEKQYWRTGPKREYNSTTYHYIQPSGPVQFTGPVILLQNLHSESSSEGFALAMRVLPNVTSIGEITGGCFAAYYPEKLINGWTLTMPWSYATDQNDFCWEGIGVPPDLRKINTREDIEAGNDKVLEFALDIFKYGGHFGKEARGSLNDMRISLVNQFLESSGKSGVKAAVFEFEKLQKNNPNGVYLSIQELMLAVRSLFSENKMDFAAAILELSLKSFPDEINIMFYLAQAYERLEQPEKAKDLYTKIVKCKAYFPWEKGALAKAEDFIKNRGIQGNKKEDDKK